MKDGGPAFPMTPTVYNQGADGMSLRDYFAAAALQGIAGSPHISIEHLPATFAKACYQVADAMLAERAKEQK